MKINKKCSNAKKDKLHKCATKAKEAEVAKCAKTAKGKVSSRRPPHKPPKSSNTGRFKENIFNKSGKE